MWLVPKIGQLHYDFNLALSFWLDWKVLSNIFSIAEYIFWDSSLPYCRFYAGHEKSTARIAARNGTGYAAACVVHWKLTSHCCTARQSCTGPGGGPPHSSATRNLLDWAPSHHASAGISYKSQVSPRLCFFLAGLAVVVMLLVSCAEFLLLCLYMF